MKPPKKDAAYVVVARWQSTKVHPEFGYGYQGYGQAPRRLWPKLWHKNPTQTTFALFRSVGATKRYAKNTKACGGEHLIDVEIVEVS